MAIPSDDDWWLVPLAANGGARAALLVCGIHPLDARRVGEISEPLAELLATELSRRDQPSPRGAPAPPSGEASPTRFPTLDEAMRRHIEAALVRCQGRIEGEHGAARLLGIHANTLRSRMHRLGIRWGRFR